MNQNSSIKLQIDYYLFIGALSFSGSPATSSPSLVIIASSVAPSSALALHPASTLPYLQLNQPFDGPNNT